MKRLTILLLVAFLLGSPAAPALAYPAGETAVSGAGDLIFPDGATFSGVPLTGSTFGMGVIVHADGSAEGDFEVLLEGTSLLGQAQFISVVGKISAGTANADGSVTFSGTAVLDLGDGTPATPAVPFSVTVTSEALALIIGATTLATQALGDGAITIE